MFGSPRRRTSALRRLLAATGVAAVMVTAACGNASDSASEPEPSGASGSADGVIAEAQERVEQRLAVPAEYELDAPPIEDAASLAGSTVLYVPISLQIPAFKNVLTGMQQAGEEVGITVEGCDAKLSPPGAAACASQAVSQGVDAVVLDNVSIELIGPGAQALKEAGIAVLQAEQFADPGDELLASLDTGGPAMIASLADWVAVDSGGDANVLVVMQNDGAVQKRYIDEYIKPSFEDVCADCTVTYLEIVSTQLPNLPSQVSAALLQDPEIEYIASEFNTAVPLIQQGLNNSPTGSEVQIAASIGDLASLQRVASGQQAYDTQISYRFVGWAIVDQVMRMLSGMEPLERVDSPWRAFDSSNIDSVEVDQASIDDESLWGGDTYSDKYRALWGIGG
jgi:ribose transport system substrate-binding protein